jgi:hypothetical protein
LLHLLSSDPIIAMVFLSYADALRGIKALIAIIPVNIHQVNSQTYGVAHPSLAAHHSFHHGSNSLGNEPDPECSNWIMVTNKKKHKSKTKISKKNKSESISVQHSKSQPKIPSTPKSFNGKQYVFMEQ